MTLIKSISGIRGTIGGKPGEGLSPVDVVKYAAAYGTFIKNSYDLKKGKIVVGRDARISGEGVNRLITSTLVFMGFDVLDIGQETTPGTEMAVIHYNAAGGIIITASHNPKQWNALKLLNNKGEFLNADEGKQILEIAEKEDFVFEEIDDIGKVLNINDFTDKHIDEVLALPLVDAQKIADANFTVAVDGVNSVGGKAIPLLLERLGVKKVITVYCEPTGDFPHNPEPLPENLGEIAKQVVKNKADVGFVVDPDVDRLAIVNEDGSMFGEEYTLVAVADYVLSKTPGNTVSNLSSSRALNDITVKHGGSYAASAVGEVNVVAKMKETNAVIGGEGNGGVIYPELHYGRDALVGVALFLTFLADKKIKCSELRSEYPSYVISKNKIQLTPEMDVDKVLEKIKTKFQNEKINTIDGVKIDFEEGWVHLRKSNTEPIIRIYAEGKTEAQANEYADLIKKSV